MAQTILTDDIITKEGLMVLEEKCEFLGRVNTQYDNQYAKSGAKVGDTIRIRKPARYTVRKGQNISIQEHIEENTSLTVSQQMGVDVEFTQADLDLSLDDFRQHVLEPQMSDLASEVEATFLTSMLGMKNGIAVAPLTFKDVNRAKAFLTQQTTPTSNRYFAIDSDDQVDLVDELKGLFQSSTEIDRQYKEGHMGTTGGFTFFESNRMPSYTSSSDGAVLTGATIDTTATDGFSELVVVGATAGTLNAGTIFSVAGVKAVHPQTGKSYKTDASFVVVEDVNLLATATTIKTYGFVDYTNINVQPPAGNKGLEAGQIGYVVGGSNDARANISKLPTAGDVITAIEGEDLSQSLAFNKDAIVFASVDMGMPKGVDMSARNNYDGISMRLVRQYQIGTDKYPSRYDILFGYQILRQEYCVRVIHAP
jgi:hypothetical protein